MIIVQVTHFLTKDYGLVHSLLSDLKNYSLYDALAF